MGLLWNVHSLHGRANAWFARESPRVLGCAFTELSFVRVSMADRTIAASFADAEGVLALFISVLGRRYRFIDRLPPAAVLRDRGVTAHKQVSDIYLCELAAAHRARLATLDQGIQHPAASLIS